MASGAHSQVCEADEIDSQIDSQCRTYLHFSAMRDGLSCRDYECGLCVGQGVERAEQVSK
jgi:hypothetical protein